MSSSVDCIHLKEEAANLKISKTKHGVVTY